MRVHEPPGIRAEARVEAAAERHDLVAQRRLGGEEPLVRVERGIGVADDVLGLAEDAVVGDQYRQRAGATGSSRDDPVDALHVALLVVCEAGALERPARLLAEMADRDREEAAHAPMIARQATAVGSSAGGCMPVPTPTRFHALIAMIAPIRLPSSSGENSRAASS